MLTFDEIKNNLKPFIDEYGIKKAGVFGSYARGDANGSSDIDLLLEFRKEFRILELCRLKQTLQERLVKTVDIVEFPYIDPLIRDNILKEVVLVYEQG